MTWMPTNELRYLVFEQTQIVLPNKDGVYDEINFFDNRKVKIKKLQQKWVDKTYPTIEISCSTGTETYGEEWEWRDVPIVEGE